MIAAPIACRSAGKASHVACSNPATSCEPTVKKLLSPSVRNPLPYLTPLVLYTVMAVGNPAKFDPRGLLGRYGLQVGLTALALAWAWPALRSLSWKLPLITWPVGFAGGLLWLVLAKTKPAWRLLHTLGYSEWLEQVARPGLDPDATFGEHSLSYWSFLAIRGTGLILVIPLAEELFLRGFFLRYLSCERWWTVGVGDVSRYGWLAAAVYGMATHPAELTAAACWFTLITWLAWRTQSFAACVAAHVMANGMLFVFVLINGSWNLW